MPPRRGDLQGGGIRGDSGARRTRLRGACEAAVQKTREELGEIDILLCGAAGNFPAPVSGNVGKRVQGGDRHRSAGDVQHVPRGV